VASRARRRRRSYPALDLSVSPETARSVVGVVLLVAGAVTLIALMVPAGGILNRYVSDVLRPLFGQGAWLLPILLLMAGIFVERAPNIGNGWGVSAIGGFVTFTGSLGLIHLIWGSGGSARALRAGGGWVGYQLESVLSTWISPAGAFVVLVGLVIGGLLLLFNLTVLSILQPFATGGRALAGVLSRPADEDEEADEAATRGRSRVATLLERGRARARGRGDEEEELEEGEEEDEEPDLPVPERSPLPLSQTVWAGSRERGAAREPVGPVPGLGDAPAAGTPVALLTADEAPASLDDLPWELPDPDLMDEAAIAASDGRLDHQRNIRIIEEKLRSFQIPATVTGTNTGPVVTQYEVRPDARVKLSRIEALSDDLAMALAARTIRIEAPIPGKDVVGIEVPNHASQIVSFRGVYDDANMAEATGKLTFALGRDVSGQAYAVDLAKMPHLLIAGATGSGKSVCVNTVIVSLLMRALPSEVRLVLIDLKRVELAAYQGLPHLLTDVIVEANDAKAALHWAVAQMEDRYRALASKSERNITAYNASPRVGPDERLPYIVIIVDELADLMMREGRKVEDPIVKLAQKARAVGVHLVLATQRPSVNVVTGLIKANVPSRIAFAMASNVDSRTVLDAQGAEDLIGRGDMLYQPADLPRPVRLQGVFVSDREVRAITDHWRDQAPEPEYDPEVLAWAGGDGEGNGQFGWLAKVADDEMTARAADLVTESGRASTSMLQTKLKLGFNRASRIMDELEQYGIIGPQDPRNPAVPRQVFGPDNWLRDADDEDEEDE
jgi:S-DNA-T family DNA segregation ATPase FtsK/SpoIIIE